MNRRLVVGLIVAAVLPAGAAHAAVRVIVSPGAVLIDAPVDVRVTGLPARAKVTLQATTKDYLGGRWRGGITVTADSRGAFDTHGSMQLFWSIRPARSSIDWGFGPPFAATDVGIQVIRSGQALAHATLVRRGVAANVVSTDTTLAAQGFVGTYYAPPPAATPAPAVLLIGGSEGGHYAYPAATLASHGYPALSVAYFKEPGLPQTLKDIPLEYFAKALRWLAAQPGVDPRRIVVFGGSRGGEAALLIGSTFPDLVHGVIAASPSDRVYPAFPGPGFAWTLGGAPVPQAQIAVETIAGPVLAFAGGKDEIWDSAAAVDRIVERARAHGRRDIAAVTYPRAGHGVVGVPNCPDSGTVEVVPGTFTELGGTPEDNLRANADSWARVLRFLAAL